MDARHPKWSFEIVCWPFRRELLQKSHFCRYLLDHIECTSYNPPSTQVSSRRGAHPPPVAVPHSAEARAEGLHQVHLRPPVEAAAARPGRHSRVAVLREPTQRRGRRGRRRGRRRRFHGRGGGWGVRAHAGGQDAPARQDYPQGPRRSHSVLHQQGWFPVVVEWKNGTTSTNDQNQISVLATDWSITIMMPRLARILIWPDADYQFRSSPSLSLTCNSCLNRRPCSFKYYSNFSVRVGALNGLNSLNPPTELP